MAQSTEGTQKGASRRQFPRRSAPEIGCICYRTQPGVSLQPRHNIGKELVDISWGGARLRVGEKVGRGDAVTLELRDTRSGEVFRARGEVRWCEDRKQDGGSAHYAGVQFTEVYSPVERRDHFLLGTTPTELKAVVISGSAGEKGAADNRKAARFAIDDYIVTCFKHGALSTIGLRKNIAREVLDISKSGTQFLSGEPLDPGTSVLFTVHLNKFGDTLEADGVVRWSKREPRMAGVSYRVGIEFTGMTNEKRKLIDFMMKWFSSYQAKRKN